MACPDCKDTNIVTPNYSEAQPPSVAEGCATCGTGVGGGGVIIPPDVNNSITIVDAGQDIAVDDNSYPGVYSFKVHYNPHIALTTALGLGAYIVGVLQSGLILLGETIDEVRLTWTYNKAVVVQNLTNDGGEIEPTLVVSDRDFTYTLLSIIANTSFTITGNDGAGRSSSIAIDTETIQFGDYVLWGDYTDMIGQLEANIAALYTDLLGQNIIISNTKGRSIFATGSTNRHQFYMLPKILGEVVFEKNNFVGGYVRLKVVSGVIKGILDGGDVETDISITNSAGYTQAYYIYQSTNDDQEDNVNPVNIS